MKLLSLTSEDWREMKTQFDIKTGRTWSNLAPNERTKITGTYVLKQFGQTFVDDRLDVGNATHTLKINVFLRYGSDGQNRRLRRRRLGGFQIRIMPVDLQKPMICNGQENTQEHLMQRFRSIMEDVSWVYDDALHDDEWVSELIISRQKTEVLVILDYDIDVSCVVQWDILCIFVTDNSLCQRDSHSLSMNFMKICVNSDQTRRSRRTTVRESRRL